jgi:hypothetical protein
MRIKGKMMPEIIKMMKEPAEKTSGKALKSPSI